MPVWRNDLGGLTFRLGHGPNAEYVKWCPAHPEWDAAAEAERLRWARIYVAVPEVLGVGVEHDESWLHTRALVGENAVRPRFKERPEVAVRLIARGLRAMHDRLPVADCPFSWSVADRLDRLQVPANPLGTEEPPAVDHLVVCHGDACAPNTLITADDALAGHVDLGSLGVADRWADLAVATYSLKWNYDGSWEDAFFETYGVERDDIRIDYYRRLWDAT